jgi:hypothetical protein
MNKRCRDADSSRADCHQQDMATGVLPVRAKDMHLSYAKCLAFMHVVEVGG